MRSYLFLAVLLWGAPVRAADINADPSNYVQMLTTLKPGDTLHLAAGAYAPTGSTPLLLSGLNGTSSQWITVTGPAGDPPTAVVRASPDGCCNVVEIQNSSFLAVENLMIDGNHVLNAFGISAGGGTANVVHDIQIEGNTLVNMDNDGDANDLGQQDDGISTKTPTWGWIIRRNTILGAGTGMYLGDSSGADPFIEGVIDDNLVDKPTGYCIEVKQQNPWPTVTGIPTQPTATLVSNNVFIKADHALTTSGPRPQVLVDGFPTTGPGAQNHYEIYGNLFFHDSDDYLLQATGRVHVHDNVFVDDTAYGGINFTDHDGMTVIDAIAYNNTVYSVGTGIAFSNAPSGTGFAVGNAIFAQTAFLGTVATQLANVTDTVANAASYVVAPSVTLGAMDFYPKAGSALHGAVMDLSSVSSDVDYNLDFNGATKDFTYRGAYAGEGTNPGWKLSEGIKQLGTATGDAGAPAPDASTGADAATDAGTQGTSGGGCGCTAAGHASHNSALASCLLLLLVAVARSVCPRCRRPTRVCYCAHVPRIETETRIVVLQHPRERDVPIGTARMATLCLPHSELHVGVSVAESPALARSLRDPARPGVLLYPGEGAIDVAKNPPRGPVTLVVVDGTWSQAKKIVKRDPELARLPRYAFTPTRPSEYRIRREPSVECVSTIEALMQVLGVLEGDPERFRALLAPFRAMVDTQIDHARLQNVRHKKKPRLPRPHPVPWVLRTRMHDVVCIAGEANAWPYHAPERERFPEELVHWSALRLATGEAFDVVVAPRSPLAPGTSRWVELAPEVITSGASLEALAPAWSRFVHEEDVFVSWGRYASKIFVASGGALSGVHVDLRQVARAWSRGNVGTMDEFIAAHAPARSLPPPTRGRAGRRIAELAHITRTLTEPG